MTTSDKIKQLIVLEHIFSNQEKFKMWFLKNYLRQFKELPRINTLDLICTLREEDHKAEDFFNEEEFFEELISIISISLHGKDISKSVYNKCRQKDISVIRKIASHIMCEKIGFKKVSVGKIMGKDHSTIVHHCKTVRGYLKVDKKFESDYNKIILALQSKKILIK